MKNQQQAEREEQQRIKSLVLNYDLQQGQDQEGILSPSLALVSILEAHTHDFRWRTADDILPQQEREAE